MNKNYKDYDNNEILIEVDGSKYTKQDIERWYLYNKRVEKLGQPFDGGRVMEYKDLMQLIAKVKRVSK